MRSPSVVIAAALVLAFTASASAQKGRTPPSAPVQKIREGVYRIGQIEVDTLKKELTVGGKVNDNVTTLEFVANTIGGAKAYESAITVNADAVSFNTALLLLGLDPAHARVPSKHFDTAAPKGDPVEIFVEWTGPGGLGQPFGLHRIRIEDMLLDMRTNATLPPGPWVYTGSTFADGRYMADIDGVLIGFVHSPAPVIENPRAGAVGAYGSVVMNHQSGLLGALKISLIVKVIPAGKPKL